MNSSLVKVGDLLTSTLVGVYAVLGVLYIAAGMRNKGIYWLDAAIPTFGVLRMS